MKQINRAGIAVNEIQILLDNYLGGYGPDDPEEVLECITDIIEAYEDREARLAFNDEYPNT